MEFCRYSSHPTDQTQDLFNHQSQLKQTSRSKRSAALAITCPSIDPLSDCRIHIIVVFHTIMFRFLLLLKCCWSSTIPCHLVHTFAAKCNWDSYLLKAAPLPGVMKTMQTSALMQQ